MKTRNYSELIGKVVRFYANPDDVVLCLPRPNAKRLKGVVVGAVEAEPLGALPEAILTVRGASGRTMDVGLCRNYVTVIQPTNQHERSTKSYQRSTRTKPHHNGRGN